jgi:polyisoprenoid-binding protein YceI
MTIPASTDVAARLAAGTLDGTWTVESDASSVTLKTRSVWGLAKVNGVFSDVRGAATVLGDVVTGQILVGSASITTKNARRDKHLKSAEILSSSAYPDIVLALHAVQPTVTGLTANGTLTVRGQTRPISFPATITGESTITVTARLVVNRAEFGVDWNQFGMASMANELTVTAVFTRS